MKIKIAIIHSEFTNEELKRIRDAKDEIYIKDAYISKTTMIMKSL